MSSSKHNKRKALVGTLLFHLGLLVCFIFLGLTYQIPPPPEEGISINFGFDDMGSGIEQMEQISDQKLDFAEEIVENSPIVEDVSTQDFEETPSVIEQTEETKKEAQEVEEKEPEPTLDTKALYPGKKQNKANSQGNSQGNGDQGSEDGDPNADAFSGGGIGTDGISYRLVGRTIAQIIKPRNESQQQGKVVVTIRVNRSGKVISASPGAKGSTTTNAYLFSKAKSAALKTSFEANSNAPEIQIGTIVYNFTLN
ncbi:MAG: energy transducer TonB [Bacteroidota bacterium]|nr:energy transducer TonB [Bacteroidota bacterium]